MVLNLISIFMLVQAITAAAPLLLGKRIVGGIETSPNVIPFQISFQTTGGFHFCGGSIYNENTILTAAHCCAGIAAYGVSQVSDAMGLTHGIDLCITHPDFNTLSNANANDIALVTLTEPIEFGESVQPVKLPKPCCEVDELGIGATLILGGDFLNVLHVVHNEECDRISGGKLHPSQLCATYPGAGKGQYGVKPGSPVLGKNGVQVGLVPWSIKPNTIAPYPGVMTKVSHFVDFIYQNTGLESPNNEFDA